MIGGCSAEIRPELYHPLSRSVVTAVDPSWDDRL